MVCYNCEKDTASLLEKNHKKAKSRNRVRGIFGPPTQQLICYLMAVFPALYYLHKQGSPDYLDSLLVFLRNISGIPSIKSQ